jgi:hypothetical protein
MNARRLLAALGLTLGVFLVGCPGNGDLDCSNHRDEVELPGDRCQHRKGAGFVNHPAPCAIAC